MLIGDQRPRLESVPVFIQSSGYDAIALAHEAGLDLDDWQQHILIGALGRRADGKWSARRVKILVSRQNGKGSILEARELAGLYLFKTDRLLIHTAHEHKTASEHYIRIWSLIQNTPDLSRRVVRHSSAYGREFIQLKAGPTVILGSAGHEVIRQESSRLLFIARTGSSGRGFTGDFIAFDEDMTLKKAQVGASLPALGARPNPQTFFTGSAGDKDSEQLAMVRRQGVDAIEGKRPVGRNAFYEFSIDWHTEECEPGCTLHDDPESERAVARANPSYNIRRSKDAVDAERDELSPDQFAREILGVGVYPAPADGWLVIPKKWYEITADKSDAPERVTGPVFAIEVAPDRSSAAISVVGRRSDGFYGLQIVEHREGTKWIVKRAQEIDAKWHPKAWVLDKRAATNTVITELERAGLTVELMGAQQVAEASGQMYDAFKDDTIRHYGQASLRTAMAAVDQRKLSESWAFDRLNSVADQSPLMSAAFALWGYLRFGVEEDYDAGDSVHFDLAEIKRMYRIGVYGTEDLKRLYEDGLIDDKGRMALREVGIAF